MKNINSNKIVASGFALMMISLGACQQNELLQANSGGSSVVVADNSDFTEYSQFLVTIDVPMDDAIVPVVGVDPVVSLEPDSPEFCLVKVLPASSMTAQVTSKKSNASGTQPKVMICHIPPGNAANAHTIVVGAPAVKAHLNHGDVLGSCDSTNVDEPVYAECPLKAE